MSVESNDTTELDCPEFSERNFLKTLSSPCFFIAYPFVVCLAVLGNCTVVGLVAGKNGAIRRATYRSLTLLLCCCELLASLVLLLQLFRLGVGRHNRLYGSTVVDAAWTTELENPMEKLRPSLFTMLDSIRDVTIGVEVFSFCMLAIDRLLAVAAPTSRVCNRKLAVGVACIVIVAMVTAELGLQLWRWLGLAQVETLQAACDHIRNQWRVNALVKAGIAITLYVISAVAYVATGVTLALRRTAVDAGGDRRALRLSLIGLAVGNLIQLLSMVPLTLYNVASMQQDYCMYVVFYINSAAVPCLTVAFNASIRDRLATKLCSAETIRGRG